MDGIGISGNVSLDMNISNVVGASEYDELRDKPKINDVEVAGNKTLADYGIAENYEALSKKPNINGVEVSGSKSLDDYGIASKADVSDAKADALAAKADASDAKANSSAAKNAIDAHISNKNNPHGVTGAQLGKTIDGDNIVDGVVTAEKLADNSGAFVTTIITNVSPAAIIDDYKVTFNDTYGLTSYQKTDYNNAYAYKVIAGVTYHILDAIVGNDANFPRYVFATSLVTDTSKVFKYADASIGSNDKQVLENFDFTPKEDGYLYFNARRVGKPSVSTSKIRVKSGDVVELNGVLFDGEDYTHFHSIGDGKYLCRVFHHAYVNNLLQLYSMYIGEFSGGVLSKVKDIGTAASDNVGPISIHRGEIDSWSGSWAGGTHGITVDGTEYPTAAEASLKAYCGGKEISDVGYYFGDVTIISKNDLYFPKTITGSDLSAATKAIRETRTYRLDDSMRVDVELSFYDSCYIVTYYGCQALTFDMNEVTFPDNELNGSTTRDASLILSKPERTFHGKSDTARYDIYLMPYGIGDYRYNGGTSELGYGYLAPFAKAYYVLVANESGKVRHFTSENTLVWGADYDYRVLSE